MYWAAFTLSTRLSTPKLLKPKRLTMPSASLTLNKRGLGLPGCGRGVTVPISIKPKPKAAKPSMTAPFLSKPAAKPTGLEKVRPITCLFLQTGGAGYSDKAPDCSASLRPFKVMSWATSASN